MSSAADGRCRALTGDDERCSLPAQEDGFCHQHDESDPTVDENEDGEQAVDENERTADDSGDSEQMVDESGDDSDDSQSVDDESAESEQAVESVDDTSDGSEDDRSANAGGDIMAVRESVQAIGHDLIGHQIDGIIEVTRDGDGWRATVEVVERSSVPDTQDILGKYEIELDTDESVSGYRRVDRYRRDDTDRDEYMG